jgi:hypothetical protein
VFEFVCSIPVSDHSKNGVRVSSKSTCCILLRFFGSVSSVSLLVCSAEKSLSAAAKSYLACGLQEISTRQPNEEIFTVRIWKLEVDLKASTYIILRNGRKI